MNKNNNECWEEQILNHMSSKGIEIDPDMLFNTDGNWHSFNPINNLNALVFYRCRYGTLENGEQWVLFTYGMAGKTYKFSSHPEMLINQKAQK